MHVTCLFFLLSCVCVCMLLSLCPCRFCNNFARAHTFFSFIAAAAAAAVVNFIFPRSSLHRLAVCVRLYLYKHVLFDGLGWLRRQSNVSTLLHSISSSFFSVFVYTFEHVRCALTTCVCVFFFGAQNQKKRVTNPHSRVAANPTKLTCCSCCTSFLYLSYSICTLFVSSHFNRNVMAAT